MTIRKAALGLAAAGALTLVGAAPSSAAPPGAGAGKGTSLCHAVPADAVTFPAGGPGYNFVQAPPATESAFVQVCDFGG